MKHVWFSDVDWPQLEAQDASIPIPYEYNKDYNTARVRTSQGLNDAEGSSSSAESIDSEDNAKYFADFSRAVERDTADAQALQKPSTLLLFWRHLPL